MASDFWKKQNKILMREKDVYISRLARSSFDVSSLKIRFGATYLITGGLGGIGLSIAHELWTKYQANIILVSRKSYSSLSEVLKNKIIGDHERAIIKAFTKDPSQRVLLLSGDVSVEGSTQECIDKGIQEFGAIHGVIHSAGVIDDGPALLKTEASIDRVLSAKVSGCLNLERALDKQPLDFFVVFSSTSVHTAPAGQYDYVAANAYVKAFATSRNQKARSSYHSHTHFLSIGWDMWQSTGMAYKNLRYQGQNKVEARRPKNPILQKCLSRDASSALYELQLSRDSMWLISEHRIRDSYALLPGTAYIELARAAAKEFYGTGDYSIEIKRVYFIEPLVVSGSDVVDVQIKLTRQVDKLQIKFVQIQKSGASKLVSSLEVSQLYTTRPVVKNLSKLISRSTHTSYTPDKKKQFAQQKFLDFGQRWQSVQEIHKSERQVFAKLKLKSKFKRDLNRFEIHPALMDVGTGLALDLFESAQENLYVPMSYHRLVVYRKFESELWVQGIAIDRNEKANTCTL